MRLRVQAIHLEGRPWKTPSCGETGRMSGDLNWLREQVRFGEKLWKEPDLGSLEFNNA